MQARSLLGCGVAMPVIYVAVLAVAVPLFPGFDLQTQPPSLLGGPDAQHPLVFNLGVILTALAGALGALGLMFGLPSLRRDRALGVLAALTGLTLLLGSIGFGMAGVFPLSDPRHYGFGMTAAAALVPLLGAISLLRAGEGMLPALLLLAMFALIVVLVMIGGGPLGAGLLMLGSIAVLCGLVRMRLQR